MNVAELAQLFRKHNNEFKKFERVAAKRTQRPDLHGLLLLDELVPAGRDMMRFAEQGTIYLDVTPAELAAAANEEAVIELCRCGVKCDLDWGGVGRGLYLAH